MSGATQLTAEQSGVYRTPDDPHAIERRAAASGAALLEADLGGVRDKSELLRALARACAFPAEFGANWDALADSLQDLSWRPAPGYVLRLRNSAAASRRLGADWGTLLEILRESAMYWKARAKPFVVFVDGAQALSAWR